MNIGYVSFRIAGNDGVSLEAERWRKILKRMGHKVVFVAGELDRRGILVPELHFSNPDVYEIHQMVVDNHVSYRKVEKRIFELAGKIEGELRQILRRYKIDCLIVANVFSLPIHFPLAVALERVVKEFKIPTIARNHDFWWERKRYLKSGCFEFFERFFPPTGELIKQVVINSQSATELKKRTGENSMVIGDSFDFNNPKFYTNGYSSSWRGEFGIAKDDIVILQATRIVPRKRIEISIELVKRLNNPKVVLVLAGRDGDESGDYTNKLRKLVKKSGIRAKFIGDRIMAERKVVNGVKMYSLWDCFHNSNMMSYPSEIEGFGNQLIEAMYFRLPIFVNRYEVYKTDLEKLGFEAVTIDDCNLTSQAVIAVKSLLADKVKIKKMTDKNFDIARNNFSFEATQEKLSLLGF